MKTTSLGIFRKLRLAQGFSLVEIVLALGIIAFALIAVLAVFPIGLTTQHSAQDDTRTAQIAGDILSSIASQAQASWPNANVVQPSGFAYTVLLNRDYTYSPALGASNDGTLAASYSAGMPYQITISTKASPIGFDTGYACEVSLRVAWQPFSQNYRDFVRVVTRY
jgi:Tfp pilus assembly protein PilV